MSRNSLWGIATTLVALGALVCVGCGSSDDQAVGDAGPSDAGGGDALAKEGGARKDAGPPMPVEAGAACELSYQCPSGTYCNLQECTQDCNTEKACAKGLVCTARGMCATSSTAAPDPTPTQQTGQLSAAQTQLTVASGDTSVKVALTGSGAVKYRLASSAPWVIAPASTGTFTGTMSLTLDVKPSLAPANASTASVTVFSDEGDVTIYISATPPLQGVWQGIQSFASVRLPGADAGTVPLPMGQATFALDIRTDGSGLRAQVDPAGSTFWAAPASGAAAGKGTMGADGSIRFTVSELADSKSVASYYETTSPSVFENASHVSRPIGRQLTLALTLNPDGSLSGTTAETIYGLTSTPVEIDGTIALHANTNATVPTFDAPAAVTMPAGPPAIPLGTATFDGGLTAAACEKGVPDGGLCSGTTTGDKWGCITGDGTANSGVLQVGFPLDPFYSPNPQGGFALPDSGTADASPYDLAADNCASDVANFRQLETPGSAAHGCANTGSIDCARFLAETTLAANPDLAAQGVMDSARAYGELFELIGNDDAVDALTDRLDPSALAGSYRTKLLAGRAAYDAALYYILTPSLFEGLRSVSVADAQGGPLVLPNAEVALARAAESLTRSCTQTLTALQIDFATSSDVSLLHTGAQADATLYFIQAALLADLDARWRGGLPSPIVQVSQFASMLSSYDQAVQGFLPDANPLGIPTAYVPLLAQSAAGPGSTTNYEQLYAASTGPVATSVAADQAAASALTAFNAAASAQQAQVAADEGAQLTTISDICGADFIVDAGPNPDLSQCGMNGGSLQVAALAIQGDQLQVQEAQENLQAAYQSYADQVAAYQQLHNLGAEEVSFVDASNKKIFDLSIAQASLQAGGDIASAIGSGLQGADGDPAGYVGLGLVVAGGTLQAAAALVGPFITQQQGLQTAETIVIGNEMNDVSDALALQQTALTFAGLATEVAIAANQVASDISSGQALLQQVQNAEAALNADELASSAAITSDPSFRVIELSAVDNANAQLAIAKVSLYDAARGLEYETNTQLPGILTSIYAATSGAELASLASCVSNAWTTWQLDVSSPNTYVTEVSLAKDVLGITGTVTDKSTGQTLSAGEQFRHYLFAQPYTPDAAHVWSALHFGTSLNDNSSLFSSLVCNDRINGIAAKLVGTSLEGNTAELEVLVDGVSTLRSCAATSTDDTIVPWTLRPKGNLAPAVIQTGVNAYPTGVMPNQSLYDFGVAESHWIVAIPDAQTSPANAQIDQSQIDDIVLQITHTGNAVGSATSSFNPTCN